MSTLTRAGPFKVFALHSGSYHIDSAPTESDNKTAYRIERILNAAYRKELAASKSRKKQIQAAERKGYHANWKNVASVTEPAASKRRKR